jgi:hypothetical protein
MFEKQIFPKKDKMERRAMIGYLVGYKASNIWKVWIPEKKNVINARDCTFDESKQYDPKNPNVREEIEVVEESPSEHIMIEDQEAIEIDESVNIYSDLYTICKKFQVVIVVVLYNKSGL